MATMAGLAGSLKPSLAHAFRKQYPGVLVRLRDLTVADSAVERGDVDLDYELRDIATYFRPRQRQRKKPEALLLPAFRIRWWGVSDSNTRPTD